MQWAALAAKARRHLCVGGGCPHRSPGQEGEPRSGHDAQDWNQFMPNREIHTSQDSGAVLLVSILGKESYAAALKRSMGNGTWNVRSMNQGKLDVVKHEMTRLNIDILGISELKWTGMGEFNSDDHQVYYCGQESLRRNGVAFIVNERVGKAVLAYNLQNDRMISVRIQGKPFNITIVQVYAPTTGAEEAEVDQFHEGLQHLLEITPKNDVLTFMGDCNAKVGSQKITGITGKFGLGVQNEAGHRLAEFCLENMLEGESDGPAREAERGPGLSAGASRESLPLTDGASTKGSGGTSAAKPAVEADPLVHQLRPILSSVFGQKVEERSKGMAVLELIPNNCKAFDNMTHDLLASKLAQGSWDCLQKPDAVSMLSPGKGGWKYADNEILCKGGILRWGQWTDLHLLHSFEVRVLPESTKQRREVGPSPAALCHSVSGEL
ncbi:Craniofacial development protein 2 [Varanus komodoensis]|nr:Craniofacial development protein 2 [Varanus komodoensis]